MTYLKEGGLKSPVHLIDKELLITEKISFWKEFLVNQMLQKVNSKNGIDAYENKEGNVARVWC